MMRTYTADYLVGIKMVRTYTADITNDKITVNFPVTIDRYLQLTVEETKDFIRELQDMVDFINKYRSAESTYLLKPIPDGWTCEYVSNEWD